MVAVSVAPRKPRFQLEDVNDPDKVRLMLAEAEPPTIPAELVIRQATQAAVEYFQKELVKLFASGKVPTSPEEALRLELEVQRICAQAGDRCCHRFVEAAHQNEDFKEFALSPVLAKPKVERQGDRDVPVTFLGGSTLKVRTPYVLARRRGSGGARQTYRGKEGNGSYPLLLQLGFLGRASPGLISEIGYRVASTTYEEAHDDLTRRGIDVDLKTVRTLALKLGGQGVKARDAILRSALSAPPKESSVRGLRLVVSTDGGKLRIRVGGKRGRRNQKTHRRRYRTRWVEPRVLAIHVIDENGKKVRHEVDVLDAKIAKCDEVFRMLVGYLKLLGAHEAEQLIIVADGALWIWDRVDELIREVGIDPARVKQVLDFYHASEHLGKIAKLRASWTDKERQKWHRKVRTQMWRGNVDAVLKECRALCKGRRSKKITSLLDYIERNRERLNYPLFRQLKVPLGSGVIESAVRRVVNLRLKGPGIIWEMENAQTVLHMRAQLKAGAWTRFVTNALNHSAAQSPETWTGRPFAAAM
jgi:hypothetical protein